MLCTPTTGERPRSVEGGEDHTTTGLGPYVHLHLVSSPRTDPLLLHLLIMCGRPYYASRYSVCCLNVPVSFFGSDYFEMSPTHGAITLSRCRRQLYLTFRGMNCYVLARICHVSRHFASLFAHDTDEQCSGANELMNVFRRVQVEVLCPLFVFSINWKFYRPTSPPVGCSATGPVAKCLLSIQTSFFLPFLT